MGLQELKGVPAPGQAYCILNESSVYSRLEVAATKGLTPLVGREQEVGLLLDRWEQVKEGRGQVVLLSGEAGIGKSRLVQTLKTQVTQEGRVRLEARCSPYHQNSAFYPLIDFLQRNLQFIREDSLEVKLQKLEAAVMPSGLALSEVVPFLVSLLSLPAHRYPLPVLTPQKQKEKTQQAILTWLLAAAEHQPLTSIWEDLQ
jgi:predicted ATPase